MRANLFVLVITASLFLMILHYRHVYDVPTAMFFTAALACFQREKFKLYSFLFPFVCLNRETAILLPLLFSVYFFSRMERRAYWTLLGYQLAVYTSIRVTLLWIFASAPGSVMYFRPIENLELYAQEPIATYVFLLFLLTISCLIVIRFRQAPQLMRTAFLLWAPILFVLYLLSGRSFELRVFVELLPVIAIIGVS